MMDDSLEFVDGAAEVLDGDFVTKENYAICGGRERVGWDEGTDSCWVF